MDYQAAENWLYARLPMFQRIGGAAYKNDLSNIRALSKALGNPHLKFPAIHIAGTNGKGSTSHMLASILQEAGYQTGLTTSPHLKDFRERIRVNGEVCSEEFVVDFIETHQEKISSLEASFFEVAIAMAFAYFAEEAVDIAVIETGMGGRLDSTNIVTPVLSVITNIGLDHTGFLGNTLAEIAAEKAGIMKPGVPVVIGESDDETRIVFEQKAESTGSAIRFAEETEFPNYNCGLKGIYQIKNIRTVLASVETLQEKGYNINEDHIRKGLENVVENTGLRGRWEVLLEAPLVVADTAHNIHGLTEVIRQIEITPHRKLHLVLGFVNDKDVPSILRLFPKDAEYYFSEPDVPRRFKVEELKVVVPEGRKASFYLGIPEALAQAKARALPEDFIFIGGSTFVVAEVL